MGLSIEMVEGPPKDRPPRFARIALWTIVASVLVVVCALGLVVLVDLWR